MTLPEPVREALDTINAKACAIVDIAEVGQVVDATDTLRDHIATLIAERDDLLNQLGECFRMAGADPDGNENRRLAPRALKAVTDLRRDYDENEDWKSRHDALAQRCAELADDFMGCAQHSRHKQAAEAWNYCADKIAAIDQETRDAG